LAGVSLTKLGVPFTELDALMHQPGWVQAETETFRQDVEAVMDRSEGWVLDGMYRVPGTGLTACTECQAPA
jgi:hypothetical protein